MDSHEWRYTFDEVYTWPGEKEDIEVAVFRDGKGNPIKTVKWETKDSGERYQNGTSGYQRDTEKGKARFELMFPKGVPYSEQMLTRVAELMVRGSEKYGDRNWERADDPKDLERFKSSAFRHLMQWMLGETDEDHAAAVIFNIVANESIAWKLNNQ